MDYSDDVFYTFLCLDSVNSLAVNGTVTSLPVIHPKYLNCVSKTNKAFTGFGTLEITVDKTLNMDIFFTKRIDSLQEAFIHPPEPCGTLFTMGWMRCFGLLKITPIHCHYKSWKSQDFFKYNSDCIHLKEESHIHLAWGWVNHGVIFIFEWTNPSIFAEVERVRKYSTQVKVPLH